ncbi:MAG TPA: SsgA family sporulation/cell division regulator [Pseudonocardia sp.]|jgi:hypothetical protein|nr:SsgA family sporulation/cell division regulator [Pseudonocardia sp.]
MRNEHSVGGEHAVICSPAEFELIAPDAPVVPVKVELSYSSRDPYAVQASFRTGNGTAVDWVFARDLLADGLIASAGSGDVRVQPCPDDADRVELELTSPSGHALFTTCARTLGNFLEQTYEAVPPTTEYSWLDFDVALSQLLDNDPARD